MSARCADLLAWPNMFWMGPVLKAKPVVTHIPPATTKRCIQCNCTKTVKHFLVEGYDLDDKPRRSKICQVCAVKLKKEKSHGLQSKNPSA